MELAADTEVLVTWEPPEIATFIEGIVYRLECRLAGENDHFAPFTVISDHIEDEAVVVKVRSFPFSLNSEPCRESPLGYRTLRLCNICV